MVSAGVVARGVLRAGLLLLAASARADEAPPTPAKAAEALVAAATDAAAFAALAARDEPDPWLVCEALVAQGRADLALRAAGSAPRAATLGIEAYLGARDAERSVTRIEGAYAAALAALNAGRFEEAGTAFDEAAASAEGVGWRRRAGSCLHLAGLCAFRRGDMRGAYARWLRRVQVEAAVERHGNAAIAAGNAMRAVVGLADVEAARAAYRAGLDALPAEGFVAQRLELHGLLGDFLLDRGRLQEALAPCEEALALARRLGTPEILVDRLLAVGLCHQNASRFAEALAKYEEAHARAEGLADPGRMARVEQQLGYVRLGVKDDERALVHFERALASFEAAGDRLASARARVNLAAVQGELGMHAEALETLEVANAALETAGDLMNLARALTMTASLHSVMGHPERGVPLLRRAEELQAAVDDPAARIGLHVTWAERRRTEGCVDEARRHLEQAEAEARAHRGWATLTHVLTSRARLEFDAGDYDRTVAFADEAARRIQEASDGLADKDAATIRARFTEALGLAALAAHRKRDVAGVLRYLETLRESDLRASLQTGSRTRPRVPEALLAEEAAARQAEAQAREALEALGEGRDRGAARAARARRDAAAQGLARVLDRIRLIERAAQRIPEPVALAQVQAALPGGAVLVMLGAAAPDRPCVAAIVRAQRAESVELAPLAAVREACREARAVHLRSDADGMAPLHEMVARPLGLAADDTLVLLSPVDALAMVPLALLVPDRAAAFVPSASAYVRSRGQAIDATKVLALGDPDYRAHEREEARAEFRTRGGRLSPLPGTRAEVEAIADVRLLGEGATEEALREALEQGPWRAVHLACHGLIDADDPLRSALAVTASAADDGFVTARDVFRLSVAARLVTLSACESGRGEVVTGVGMLGLAQAFQVAGARSVLCSLWKVDDQATRALMTRFYALWRGDGIPAVEALRRAMLHVRSQEGWESPTYWAAWVLWNTPE